MNQERPAPEDVPGSDGIEVMERQNQDDDEDTRESNGTGEDADEEQLGVTNEDVRELANDAEGG